MQRKFHQYNLSATLTKKHSHVTYLASPINAPELQVILTMFVPSLLRTPHERESFLRKARHIKELQHPHLIPILDIGVEEEQPFIVREYLPNGSLRSRMKQISPRRLELKEALTIVSQVGKALTYTHEHTIVHGNIKPENILFGADDQILLTDFHLVARTDAIIRDQTSDEYAFCYLAPEQFTGMCDARSDQYALGCVAYELITGRVPFVTQSLASMMGQASNTLPAPLSESVADLPPTLEVAVLKALAKDPNERFFDFSLFLEVIQSVLSPTPPFPLFLSTTFRKDKTIFQPVKSAKAEAISSPIRRRASKRAVPRQPEPSGASSSTEDNIATSAVSLSTLDTSIPKQVASIPSPEPLELRSEVDLFVSPVSESTDPLSEETDDSADQSLHLQKRNEFFATTLETIPPFDTFTAEQGIDIQLAQEETDVSLLPKLFAEEETEILPLEASADSSHKQDILGIDEKTQLQTSMIGLSKPRMAGLSSRKRVLGIALLLSVIVALLAYEFRPFETAKPGITPHSVQNIARRVIIPIPQYGTAIPTGQPSPQATTQPAVQSSLPLQGPIQETTATPLQGSVPTKNMFVSFYGWTDNSPAGASIAYPKLHSSAGGVGTYSNPITFGSSVNELSPGTIIYVQYLKKYFIMEDECSSCNSDWKNNHRYEIVLWIGGDANSSSSAIQDCENSLTPKSSMPVVVQPSSNLTVDTTPLFTDSGGCIKL